MSTAWDEARARAAQARAEEHARRSEASHRKQPGNAERSRSVMADNEWCTPCGGWRPRPHNHQASS